jgi:hypothetical protein
MRLPGGAVWLAMNAPTGSSAVPPISPKMEKNARRGFRAVAAYQTRRAGASFGRAWDKGPDTGRRPGLCTLARSAGQFGLRIPDDA